MSSGVRTQTRTTQAQGNPVPDNLWTITSDTGPLPGIDINGVAMLFTPVSTGPAYFYRMTDSITNGLYINTDHNGATPMTEGNIMFQRLAANPVTYGDGTIGRTVRVNVNAGGFIPAQVHTWQTAGVTYLWTPKDSKNAEFTYYYRANNNVHPHVKTASKMRGGIHTGSNDPRASTFELDFNIGGGGLESALEYNHPNYHFSNTIVKSANLSQIGKWIGRKTVVWTGKSDGKVHARDYVDWNPFYTNGRPQNHWVELQEQTFVGDSTYNKIPVWGGQFIARVDGFSTVDFAIVSLVEIVPPT